MDIVFSLVGFYLIVGLTDRMLRARGYRGPVSDHFNGKIFFSYGKRITKRKGKNPQRSLWKWLLSRHKSNWEWRNNEISAEPDPRIEGSKLVVTFVNHSTMLIQTEGLNILTDPIWSKRSSPFSFIGPKRFREPGIRFEDLPPIDIVLISHNHYDHMDIPTLRRLQKKWNPRIFVGLGNKAYLLMRGVENIHEMDWWDKEEIRDGFSIVCAPGQHFSSRALSDRDNTLWCGFVIETKDGNIYFAGDTGYGPFVEKLKEHYVSFRLAFLPIGAFRPEWFMGPVHISPDQALQMHRELQVRTSIGMHFGTFHLADDEQDEPKARIGELLATAGENVNFLVIENGHSVQIA